MKSKFGIIFSSFDLMHPGHLEALRFAKDHCEHLVVALHVDPSKERANKNRPVETIFERYLRAHSCKYVDGIIPYETERDILNILKIYKPNVRFLGEEYSNKPFTGCEIEGIEIKFIPRDHDFSSSGLRERIVREKPN